MNNPGYEVTPLEPCRNFTWEVDSLGCTVKAGHLIQASGAACELAIRLSFHGLLALIIGLIAGSTTKEYVELQAEGFKKECEQRSA